MKASVRVVPLLLVLYMICAAGVAGQNVSDPSSRTFYLSGTKVDTFIPAGMDVTLRPYQLETSDEMSLFYYKFSVTGKETVKGLRWNVYVSDYGGNILSEDSWWDRGRWKPKSETESVTVFKYSNPPGTKLTVVLREVLDETGVKKIDLRDVKQRLRQTTPEPQASPLRIKLTAHTTVSEGEEKTLLRRALSAILASEDLKRHLLIKQGDVVFFATDNPDEFDDLPDISPVRPELVTEKFRAGEAINYFEYCCLETRGPSVRLTLNYHMPEAKGKSYVRKGVRIETRYLKNRQAFILDHLKTEYF